MGNSVAGFDWDEGNLPKCQKHGVTISEIEAAFQGPMRVLPDPAHLTTDISASGKSNRAATY